MRPWIRIARCVAATTLPFAALAIALALPRPAAALSGPAPSPADWRKDLRILLEELEAVHPDPWFHTPRATVEGAVDELSARLPGMSREESLAGLYRIVAMLHDGHTSVPHHANAEMGLQRVQAQYLLFPDGLHVIAAHPDHPEVLGGRVTRIGYVDADETLRRIEPLVPRDNEWTVKDRAPYHLTFADLLVGVGVLDDASACPIEVETDGGRRVRATIPCTLSYDEETWPTAQDAAGTGAPLYLSQPGRSYFFEHLPDENAMYLLFRRVRNDDDESFEDFCARAFTFLDEHEVDRLIVDLRLNGGGNNFLNRPLVHGIIRSDRVNREGHLFVVTGRRTFSAAMCGTIDLERQTNALFVGEPTGATPNHHGDAVAITLPNTGITVRISALYWQNSDPRDRRRWVEPDVPAELTWADYVAGRDPALAAALAYEGGKREHIGRVMWTWLEEGQSVAKAIARYEQVRDSDERTRYHFGEFELNQVGYGLLEKGRTEDALTVLRLNTEEFPDQWNPWDSLGEALAAAGRTEEAIRAYERSLALNPANGGGQAAVRRLRREAEGTR